MHGFAYTAPASQAEVIDLLREHGSAARLLAGGTDLVVGLQTGRFQPAVVVDLKRVAELRPAIDERPGGLTVSATTTMSRLIRDERVAAAFPALVEAALTVGSVQIRNRATLAGNICNASPAADTAPALLVYRASVAIAGPDGVRSLPLEDFILGPRRTALGPAELVTAVELPWPEPGAAAAFGRLTRRRGVDLATISMCCSVEDDRVRFALGAVAPAPFVVEDSSGVLVAPDAPPESRGESLARLMSAARPISDVRASREYREAMLLVFARRLLATALDRRRGDAS